MATSFTWALPEGFTASPIDWPVPQQLNEGPLSTYSYIGTVFLPATITAPANLNETSYTLKVKADWLVCEDICIPESADLELTLPVAATAQPTGQNALFEAHLKQMPHVITTPGSYYWENNKITFTLSISELKDKTAHKLSFFPRQFNIISYTAKPEFSVSADTLTFTIDGAGTHPQDTVTGLLTLNNSVYDVSFAPSSGAITAAAPQTIFLPTLLLLALLGGLVLNLMPCVLPVLSIKALAIAKKSGAPQKHVVKQGMAYTLGILVSFAVIAGILLALRSAGESVGWGYQMQSPAFVGFLIYLLFMVGLNLSGYFHLPVLLGNTGSDIANESSARGSFFTGVLATAVATPCTAPFMASAVGIALTLPSWQALLIFEALGFGLALPFLLISLFPALRRFLPKPGQWMNTFKELLAFPMYASVIWLLWVLTLQTGTMGMVIALSGLLIIILIIWMKSLFSNVAVYRLIALIAYIFLLGISLPLLNGSEPMAAVTQEEGITVVSYSAEKLSELRKAGTPVYVDATAAWCITCQVNARVALHTDRTMEVFKREGIALMIADWTRRNDDITAFLTSFGYKGVPLNVFYPAEGEPRILPQILTEDIVINTIQPKE